MAVRKIEQGIELSLEEARARYHEVKEEFEQVQRRYARSVRGFFGFMRQSDQTTLANCVGVLLPLTLQKSVQEECRTQRKGLYSDALNLNLHIMNYLADFRNTPVWRTGGR